jgi:hypothetical protein
VDEIHRFNKAQQDGFLPHMEDGTILLVGATTENPSFELNAALLSAGRRCWCWTGWGRRRWRHSAGRAEAEIGPRDLPLDPRRAHGADRMADGDGRAL